MTQIATHTKAPSQTGPLMNLIITLLTPIFLGVTAGDISLARTAAQETVNAYRASSNADLIAIAQIIAFGLAAVGSLSLSMDDDMSLSMTLRLRANAVALNRSAEQNRRAMNKGHAGDPAPTVEDDISAAEQQAATKPAPAAQPETQHQEMRAIAMVREASELAASIANLPPAERPAATMRAAMLSSTAHDLLYGSSVPPSNGHTRPDANSKPRLQ